MGRPRESNCLNKRLNFYLDIVRQVEFQTHASNGLNAIGIQLDGVILTVGILTRRPMEKSY